MILEKNCNTCRKNCDITNMAICNVFGFANWEPNTNADRIRKMTNEEIAEWMMKANAPWAGVTGLMCDDLNDCCWDDCQHDHMCGEAVITEKEDVLMWLDSPVDVYE